MRLAAVVFAGIAFSAPSLPSQEKEPEDLRLECAHVAIQLESPERGLGVSPIEHESGGGTPEPFVKAAPGSALIRRLILRGPPEKAEEIRVDAANLSPEPRKASCEFDGKDRGLPAGAKRLRLAKVLPSRTEDLGEVDSKFRRSESLASREILAIEIQTQ